MSENTNVTELSAAELDAVSGGYFQANYQNASNVNVSAANGYFFGGDTSQNASTTQQAANVVGGFTSVGLWSSTWQRARA